MIKPSGHSLHPIVTAAIWVFFLDAFVLGQGAITLFSGLLGLIWGLSGVIFAKDRTIRLYKIKLGLIWVVAAGSTLGCITINNRIAKRRAEKVVAAIQAYRTKNNQLPDSLNQLVPDYIPKIPLAKFTFTFNSFVYSNIDSKASLGYTAIPPFGRPTFVFNRNEWIYLD